LTQVNPLHFSFTDFDTYTTAALTPFHKNAEGDFYTPANSRNIRDLGYTYPELANNPSNETLIAMLIRDYSGPETGGPAKVKRQAKDSTSQAYLADAQLPSTGSPYSLYVFLGDVKGEAEEWSAQESFVGLASTLGTHGDKPVRATVDVTKAVEAKIEAGETTEQGVVDYLKANLKWRLVFVRSFLSAPKNIPLIRYLGRRRDFQGANSRSESIPYFD
jgi:tyrosinase